MESAKDLRPHWSALDHTLMAWHFPKNAPVTGEQVLRYDQVTDVVQYMARMIYAKYSTSVPER